MNEAGVKAPRCCPAVITQVVASDARAFPVCGHAGDNENTAMPAGSTIITVISGMTGSIVDQLNEPAG